MQDLVFTISLYLGIVGFLLFSVSFLTGLRVIKFNVKYRVHRRVGIIGFAAMFIHGLVMSYQYFFS